MGRGTARRVVEGLLSASSMRPKGCLARLALGFSLVGIALILAFAFHVHRVMSSGFMTDLERRSEAYPCIGSVHDPKRPAARSEVHVARHYLLTVREPGMSIDWHPRFALTILVIDISTERDEANRLFAALPTRRFRSFDDVARHYSGKSYCALDPVRRQAVLDYYSHPREKRLEQAMGAAR